MILIKRSLHVAIINLKRKNLIFGFIYSFVMREKHPILITACRIPKTKFRAYRKRNLIWLARFLEQVVDDRMICWSNELFCNYDDYVRDSKFPKIMKKGHGVTTEQTFIVWPCTLTTHLTISVVVYFLFRIFFFIFRKRNIEKWKALSQYKYPVENTKLHESHFQFMTHTSFVFSWLFNF